MSQQSWARGMRSMAAPASTPALRERRSEARQQAESEMVMLQSALVRASSAGDEDEEDAEMEGQLVALQEVAATDVADVSELDALLAQLKTEPQNDDERVEKFGLYEKFLETIESLRTETFNFWRESKDNFVEAAGEDGGSSVLATMERNLASIDAAGNMAIDFSDTRWFVYDMTRKANNNNSVIGRVLQEIKTKLELIAHMDESCPICLDAMSPAPIGGIKVLGCCHKVCAPCWAQWQEIKHGHAFCPLCKHEEFMETVVLWQQQQPTPMAAEPAPAPEPEPEPEPAPEPEPPSSISTL